MPVGVPVVPSLMLTVAVNVTDCPNFEGFTGEVSAVAVGLEDHYGRAGSESLFTFGVLDEARIAADGQSGEPFDKAGAYGIQGRAGAFVERIEGSYTGVMGLPLFETVLKGLTIRGSPSQARF